LLKLPEREDVVSLPGAEQVVAVMDGGAGVA
jgi:hypothetical protein